MDEAKRFDKNEENMGFYPDIRADSSLDDQEEDRIESYFSCLHSEQECQELIYLARIGTIGKVRRRLNENEKNKIRPGSIFIYKEQESGIRRWTDKREWTPSRVQGIFLVYRDLNGPMIKKTYACTLKDGRYHIVAYSLGEWESGGRCCNFFRTHTCDESFRYDMNNQFYLNFSQNMNESPEIVFRRDKVPSSISIDIDDASGSAGLYSVCGFTNPDGRIFIKKDEGLRGRCGDNRSRSYSKHSNLEICSPCYEGKSTPTKKIRESPYGIKRDLFDYSGKGLRHYDTKADYSNALCNYNKEKSQYDINTNYISPISDYNDDHSQYDMNAIYNNSIPDYGKESNHYESQAPEYIDGSSQYDMNANYISSIPEYSSKGSNSEKQIDIGQSSDTFFKDILTSRKDYTVNYEDLTQNDSDKNK